MQTKRFESVQVAPLHDRVIPCVAYTAFMALRWARHRAGDWPHMCARRDGVDVAGVVAPK